MRLLSTKRRPSDKAFKHDGTNRPPITTVVISLSAKDFGSDVVGSTHSGVGQLPTRFSPGIDLGTVADGQLDLVQIHRIPVFPVRLVGSSGKKLLVIAGLVLFMETC